MPALPLPGLCLDVDFGTEHKKPNLPPTQEDAFALIEAMGLAPTFIIHSGHGLQAWWKFREPWILDTEEERDKAERLTKSWCATLRARAKEKNWDADQVGDLPRVMRLPGLWNRKGVPKRTSTLTYHAQAEYITEDFETCLLAWSDPSKQSELPDLDFKFELSPDAEPPSAKLLLLCENYDEFKRLCLRIPIPGQKDLSPSGFDHHLARIAFLAGWSAQEVTNLLIAQRRAHRCELKLDHTWGQGTKSYYKSTLTKALNGKTATGSNLDATALSHGETSINGHAVSQPLSPYDQRPILDPHALYGLMGDLVRLLDPHTEADPVALLIQGLAAFGNSLNRGPYFTVEADQHTMNLFAVLVGDTSRGRKGTSWGHIRKLFHTVDEAWASTRVLSGMSSGEGLIWAVHDEITKTEAIKKNGRYTGEFQTVVVDPGIEDKRLFVIEPEFATVLRVSEREGNTLSAVIRQAWETGALNTLTKHSQTKATGAHISIIGHITKDELSRLLGLTETANGFCNRFLWLCVRRSKCLPHGGSVHDVDFAPLIQRLRHAIQFARSAGRLHRDEEANHLWEEVYPTLSEGKSGLLGAIIARSDPQVLRLQCLYALLDQSSVIRVEHLRAALAVWSYCEASARYIFGQRLGDPIADELIEALRQHPTGMTRTEIRDWFGRNRKANELDRGLGLLKQQGLARSETQVSGGRPTERWFLATTKTTETTKAS